MNIKMKKKGKMILLIFCLILIMAILSSSAISSSSVISIYDVNEAINVEKEEIINEITNPDNEVDNEVYATCKGDIMGENYGVIEEEMIEPLKMVVGNDYQFHVLNPPPYKWEIYNYDYEGCVSPHMSEAFQEQDPDNSDEYFPKTPPVIRYQYVIDLTPKFTSYIFNNNLEITQREGKEDIEAEYFSSLTSKCGGSSMRRVYLVYHIDDYWRSLCNELRACNFDFCTRNLYWTDLWGLQLSKYTITLILRGAHAPDVRVIIKQGAVVVAGENADVSLKIYNDLYNHNFKCCD